MGKVYDGIDARLREFIESQPMFFVGSAPLSASGHVDVSPKGVAGTLTVVDEHTVAYLDITASGAETVAHVRENGRIVLMFCSFDRTPKVLRLHGRARVPVSAGFQEREVLVPHMERKADVAEYRIEKNRTSLDGLRAFDDDPVA